MPEVLEAQNKMLENSKKLVAEQHLFYLGQEKTLLNSDGTVEKVYLINKAIAPDLDKIVVIPRGFQSKLESVQDFVQLRESLTIEDLKNFNHPLLEKDLIDGKIENFWSHLNEMDFICSETFGETTPHYHAKIVNEIASTNAAQIKELTAKIEDAE